jgi:hypothetical protein
VDLGTAVYTPLMLRAYDTFVLELTTCRYVRRYPKARVELTAMIAVNPSSGGSWPSRSAGTRRGHGRPLRVGTPY